MQRIIPIVAIIAFAFSLSGCIPILAGTAGAEGGYIYKEDQDKKGQ